MDKASIRQMMKTKRLQNEKTFSAYSACIKRSVLNHPRILSASMIACYVSLKDEVDTHELISELLKKHHVCVPKVQGHTMAFYEITSLDDLQSGHFHVLEPVSGTLVDSKNIDLMIIPMLGYDDELYRVGYGKGYYDHYLAAGFTGYKLGLAYSFQHVHHIDYDPYDIPLDEIITEKA